MMSKPSSLLLALLVARVLAAPSTATAQRFYPDDPIWEDEDRIPIPLPEPVQLSQIVDFAVNSFPRRPQGPIPPAENINTLGEVPSSSWFTNRMGTVPMTLKELRRGPNQYEGPDLSSPWQVVSMKTEGLTPGFTIEDRRGDRYLVKLDPVDYPQLATSTEVIATKFFHAFGYHVPENYLVFIRSTDLVPGPEATIEEADRPRKLRKEDIDFVLERVARRPDGTYQVMASRYVPGRPIGPFEFYGTRSDDANDIFRHENRRELRGLRVFSAWLNHDDSRSVNTLNTYIPEGELGYLRHYLIDFGSTMGSGSIEPQNPKAGHEYRLEVEPILKAAVTAGIWDRPWRKADYPDYPAIGNFEAEFFHPARWKPEYPNPAFDRMLPEDAFWAAKIVHAFTDEMVRAIVATGKLDDPEAEAYLIETLLERRDKIVRHYFGEVNPLDRFRLTEGGNRLVFANLGIEAELAPSASYAYQWFRFDNHTGEREALTAPSTAAVPDLPVADDPAPFLMVRIRTDAAGQPAWKRNVDVYIRNAGTRMVVGRTGGEE